MITENETSQGFQGEYEFLSNFCEDYPVTLEGITFRSREAAFQALKTSAPGHGSQFCLRASTYAEEFAQLPPGKAKRLGRKVPLRPDWERIKRPAMAYVVDACARQNPEFKKKLIATGNTTLVEYNTWGDTYWGICDWEGRNELGKILMGLRNLYKRNPNL